LQVDAITEIEGYETSSRYGNPACHTGILLATLGAFILVRGFTVHSQGTVSVGPIHGTVQEQHTAPALLGRVAIVGGVLLAVAGVRRRR